MLNDWNKNLVWSCDRIIDAWSKIGVFVYFQDIFFELIEYQCQCKYPRQDTCDPRCFASTPLVIIIASDKSFTDKFAMKMLIQIG